jgi:hypothetical protein
MTTSALGSGNPCVAKTAIEYALLGALIAPCGSYGHHCGVSVAERAGWNGRVILGRPPYGLWSPKRRPWKRSKSI